VADRDFLRRLPDAEADFERRQALLWRAHVDLPLLVLVLLICGYGLVILYSAVDQDMDRWMSQVWRLGAAFGVMLVAAQVDPRTLQRWSWALYGVGVLLLVAVLFVGTAAKGAQRWIDLPGLPRFQPSEIMKLAVPIMVAAFFAERSVPPKLGPVLGALVIIAVPAVLIALQPDLGTAILVAGSGLAVLLLAGVRWSWIAGALAAAVAALPALWMVMKDYQRQRVLTLFDPESDPLGAGWNIIQSKTAIGSGGLFGKGLFEGTQSHLDFLPESHTDFIIAVMAEETFFTYLFVNIGMVSGLLPVVGVPLPLVSYGGTSALTLLAGFGILMAVATQRKLLNA
jgi:rod shape determining protein RodA